MGKNEEKLLAVVVQRGVNGREGWPEASVAEVLWSLVGHSWVEMTTAAQRAYWRRTRVGMQIWLLEVQCQGWEWCATSEMLSPAASRTQQLAQQFSSRDADHL